MHWKSEIKLINNLSGFSREIKPFHLLFDDGKIVFVPVKKIINVTHGTNVIFILGKIPFNRLEGILTD